MSAVRAVARLVAVGIVGVAAVSACTDPGPPRPPRPTTTTVPEQPGVPGVVSARDFVAYVNAQGPNPPRLIVTGTLVLASPAYSARLVPASPQGINPRILLLRLETSRSDAVVPQITVERQVRLEASPGYDRVTILDLGLDLPVSTVH